MNETLNITNFTETNSVLYIPCSDLWCYIFKIYAYIGTVILFTIIVFLIYFMLKGFNQYILQLFTIQRLYLLKNKRDNYCCLYDIWGIRSYVSNNYDVLKKKRQIYKLLWINSFVITISSIIFFIMLYIMYFEITLYISLSLIGGLAIIIGILCQFVFLPYFTGFLYILFDKLEYFEDYNLKGMNNNQIFKNVKFLGVTFDDIIWYYNEKKEPPFKMGTGALKSYIIQKTNCKNDGLCKQPII